MMVQMEDRGTRSIRCGHKPTRGPQVVDITRHDVKCRSRMLTIEETGIDLEVSRT